MITKTRRIHFADGSFVDDYSTDGPEWVSNHGSERYRISSNLSVLVMENGNVWGITRKFPGPLFNHGQLHMYPIEEPTLEVDISTFMM